MEPKIKKQKRIISPFTLLLFATLFIIFLSGILSFFDVQTTGIQVQPATNDIDSYVIAVESMLSVEGLQYIIGNATSNFVGFAPLGMLIIALMGIGVAQQTGLLRTLFTVIAEKVPKKTLTFLVVFISVLSSIYIDAAYVLIMPLAAILFMTNGRHPITGVVASFAGIAGGYGITALVGSLDSSISAYTSIAARLLDPEYGVTIWSNIYIMVLGTILISYIGMLITEKITVPHIGRLKAEEDLFEVGKLEMTALKNALFVVIILGIVLMYGLIPSLPGSGFLLDNTTANYVNKLLGAGSYFYKGGTVILSGILLIAGFVYGITAKTVKEYTNFIKGSLDDIGNLLIMIFAASQFIAIFKQTNIGPYITGSLTNVLSDLNFSGLPLIFLLLIIVIISNLFFTSPVGKWMIMSPVVVPLLMQANISPEFTQMIFRVGQSVSNGITPVLAYFIVYVAFVNKYNPEKEIVPIGTCLKYSIPYSIAFLAVWVILLLSFYLIGLPIGVNASPTL